MLATYIQTSVRVWQPVVEGLVGAFLSVCAALHTKASLRILTRGAVPFTRRAIWLLNGAAVIIAGVAINGLSRRIAIPWIFVLILDGVIAVIAYREKIEEIVPVKPPQDANTYRLAWHEYERLGRNVLCSSVALALVILIGGVVIAKQTHPTFFIVAFLVIPIAIVANYYLWKLMNWSCPRCGYRFHRVSLTPVLTAFMQAKCAHCDLPEWAGEPNSR